MKRLFTVAGWLLFVAVLLVAGLRMAGHHFDRVARMELHPHVRLEPARPHLAEHDVTPDNAYFYIRQITNFAAEAFSQEVRDELGQFQQDASGEQEFPLLHDWEANNRELLALLRKIQATPDSQVTTIDSVAFLVPYVSPVLALTRLFAYLNERDARSGDWELAWDRFVLGVDVCDRILPGGGLISHLVAYAGHNRLLYSLRRASWRNAPPPVLSSDMIDYLMQMASRYEPFDEALRYEYIYAKLATDLVWRAPLEVQALTSGVPESSPVLSVGRPFWLRLIGSSPAKTRQHIDAVYSQMIAAVQEGRADEFQAEFERLYSPASLGVGFYVSDPIGRLLIAMLVPSVSSAHHRAIYTGMDGEATATVLALVRYREDHKGRLPDRLEVLVPDYLPRLPADQYRPDHPLIYRVEGDHFRLYSVGPNGVDNGGEHHHFGADERVKPLSDLLFLFGD